MNEVKLVMAVFFPPYCRFHHPSNDRFGCGFNPSTQHLISDYREEDVENEAATEDLLLRQTESLSLTRLCAFGEG